MQSRKEKDIELKKRAKLITDDLISKAAKRMAEDCEELGEKPDFLVMGMLQVLACTACFTFGAFAGRNKIPEDKYQEQAMKEIFDKLTKGHEVGNGDAR